MVLIVEDDLDLRNILRQWVESMGLTARSARDGLEGLAQVARRRPDLILCDLAMPLLDGCAMVERLRSGQDSARVPVIAITGLTAPETVLRTLEAGFDGHLVKPVTRAMIAAQLKRFLRQGPTDKRPPPRSDS